MKRTYTCRRCGERGHNRATCQRRIDPPRVAIAPDTAFSRALPLLGTMPDVDVADAVGAACGVLGQALLYVKRFEAAGEVGGSRSSKKDRLTTCAGGSTASATDQAHDPHSGSFG